MDDWRLTNQLKYLYKKKLKRCNVLQFPSIDHEHCSFCWNKFGKHENMLKEGYCTEDTYYWICEICFADFNEMFEWELVQG